VGTTGGFGSIFRGCQDIRTDQRKAGGNGYQFQQFASVHHRFPFVSSETAN
jgi:hypothetical protein